MGKRVPRRWRKVWLAERVVQVRMVVDDERRAGVVPPERGECLPERLDTLLRDEVRAALAKRRRLPGHGNRAR